MAKITSKGRVTIPLRIRTALRLRPGDRIDFMEMKNGQFVMIAANRSVRELKGLFYDKQRKPVTIEEMNAAIACAVSDSFKRRGRRTLLPRASQ